MNTNKSNGTEQRTAEQSGVGQNAAGRSLDPQSWDGMRALGHRMVDDMMDYLQSIRERPVWQADPDEVRQELNVPLPVSPQEASSVYDDFIRNVLPYNCNN